MLTQGSRVLAMVALALGAWTVPPGEAASAQERDLFQVSAGAGLSFPRSSADGWGRGGSVAIQRVFPMRGWVDGRLYAGGFYSTPNRTSCGSGIEPCAVYARTAVAGAKLRLLAPIPYVAPFVEAGAGIAIGSVHTEIGRSNLPPAIVEAHRGVMFNIPFGLGLAFGRRHQHDLSFQYFTYPGTRHVDGVLALGVGFAMR